MIDIIKILVSVLAGITEDLMAIFSSLSIISSVICLLILFIVLKKMGWITTSMNALQFTMMLVAYNVVYLIILFASMYLMDKTIQ
jgi:hypothetical protein